MNLFLTLICLSVSLTTTQRHLTEVQQQAVLHEANNAYAQGVAMQSTDPVSSQQSFKTAANRYQLLVTDGVENGKLWYNLGNAYLQSHEVGEAIAAYKSAERFVPLDGRLKANLSYARSLVDDPFDGKNSKSIFKRLTFWHNTIPTQIRLYIALGAWAILFTILTFRLVIIFPVWKTGSVLSGVTAMLIGFSVFTDVQDQHRQQGVLVANDVILRSGQGDNYAPLVQTPLNEGIEFEVVGERSEWLQIKLSDGKIGWVQKQDAQIVTLNLQEQIRS